MEDGINADKNAEDYKHRNFIVDKGDILNAKLTKGGGWIAIITKI